MATGLGTAHLSRFPFYFSFSIYPSIFVSPFLRVSLCPCKNFAAPYPFHSSLASYHDFTDQPYREQWYVTVTHSCHDTTFDIDHAMCRYLRVPFIVIFDRLHLFVFICRFAKRKTIISFHI